MKADLTPAENKYAKLIGVENCIKAYEMHVDGSGASTIGESFLRDIVPSRLYTKAGDCVINAGRKLSIKHEYLQLTNRKEIKKDTLLKWKVTVPNLFAEIIRSNNNMWIMKIPLTIVNQILREGASIALKLNDEQMISIFARLGMYEGCTDMNHPDYDKLMELSNKTF